MRVDVFILPTSTAHLEMELKCSSSLRFRSLQVRNEDDFAAMLAEEVLPQFHFALIEAKVMTVATQQTVATFAPNPVAQIIAQNCATGGRRDHQPNGEAVGRLLASLLPCLDGHLLGLTLAACDADPFRAARFTDGKQNREDTILKLRLDIVGIDRPGEGDRPFKRAGDDFPREPVVSLTMTFRLATLRLLCLLPSVLLFRLCWALLALHLPLGLALMIVLVAVAPSNR